MDQNVQTHTAGDATGYAVSGTAHAVGDKSIQTDTGTSGTFNVGDLISFAGHTQSYVVTTSKTGAGALTFEPGLVAAPADAAAIAGPGDSAGAGGIGDHVMNLGFHRDAIAFATRPLIGSMHPGSIIDSQFDPVSGLTLRLEVSRQNKQDKFSFDILYGAEVIRRELGARLLG
jgi:hypothetical protein